jgi:argininosuccinate lyase
MEYLVRKGVPLRTAHDLVGRLVRLALDRGVPLAELSLDDFQQAHAALDESVYDVLGAERAVAAFVSYGSTAPAEVQRQIERWKELLKTS